MFISNRSQNLQPVELNTSEASNKQFASSYSDEDLSSLSNVCSVFAGFLSNRQRNREHFISLTASLRSEREY